MSIFPTKLRLMVVASLLVGLTAAGVSPCPLAAASCGPAAASKPHGARGCCCGADCDGSCGAACCQSPAPKQDRAPAAPKSSDELSTPWGLSLAAVIQIDAPAAADLRHALLGDGVSSFSCASLLALNVRLNV
jgi:hypothetical protein